MNNASYTLLSFGSGRMRHSAEKNGDKNFGGPWLDIDRQCRYETNQPNHINLKIEGTNLQLGLKILRSH